MNKLNNLLLVIALSAFICPELKAQADTLHLNIFQVIEMAKTQSVSAVISENELQTAYWEYKTFKAEQLPEISIDGTLPNYRRSFSPYQHEDGSYSYVRNNNLSLGAGLNITQNIPFTGGQIRLGSSLDYTAQLGGNLNQQGGSTSQLGGSANEFLSVPIELILIQPLFSANQMKWDRIIEPLKYEEAQIKYSEDMVVVTMEAIDHYFNFLLAYSNLGIAVQNHKNANKLHEVGKAKREIGELSKNELIQLEIESLQSKATLTEAESDLRAKMFQLNAFLGLSEGVVLDLEMPITSHAGRIMYPKVLDLALENSSFAKNILRRQREADYAVALAKGNKREINLYAAIGLSGIGQDVRNSYNGLVDNQVVEVGLSIPILDWGKREAQVKFAESNKAVEESKIREEEISFNQEIFLLVENFNNQSQQMQIALESDKLAQNRYEIAMQTFILGEISLLELNDARDTRDAAAQRLISETYHYWSYYYNIQWLTLETVEELMK